MSDDLCCVRCVCAVHEHPPRIRLTQAAQSRGAVAVVALGLGLGLALALGVTLAGCAADEGRGEVFKARADTERAVARATEISNDRQVELNRLEVTSRATSAAVEQAGR